MVLKCVWMIKIHILARVECVWFVNICIVIIVELLHMKNWLLENLRFLNFIRQSVLD